MSESKQLVTFHVPPSVQEPMKVDVRYSGLRMVLVNRESVELLDSSWQVRGVYFLLGPSPDPEHPEYYRAYVGEVGKRNLVMRMKEHRRAKTKPWWSRALLVASASDEFNSAEIGWLEGRLYDVLKNAEAGTVMNEGRPGDESLAQEEQDLLERYVPPITAALRACGAPPDTLDQRPTRKVARAHYRESVKDLIDADLLKAGTHLRPLRPQLTQTAAVLSDGRLQIGEEIFSAVSPAAAHVSGGVSEPGWHFWGAPSGDGTLVPLARLRDRLRASGGTSEPKARNAVPPANERPGAAAGKRRKPRRYPETVSDLLDAGLLTAGEALRPVRKKLKGSAVLQPDGSVEVAGAIYWSLSGAAQALSGRKAEPGWGFWTVDREGKPVTLHALRAQLRETSHGSSGA